MCAGLAALTPCDPIRYSVPNDNSQDVKWSLARAFDQAWDVYYRPGRLTLGPDIARTELARRLVELWKEGVRDEKSLVERALSYLNQIALIDAEMDR